MGITMKQLVQRTIAGFCCEFVRNPYLCYTEHGQHALFFSQLLAAIPEPERYGIWRDQKVCLVQKEYATACNLGKSKRQHWDVAVLKSPILPNEKGPTGYDYLRLEAVIEFGMNKTLVDLEDDIQRISHPDSNADNRFVVHLYRFSQPGSHFSGRDWSPHQRGIATREDVLDRIKGKPVEVYYAIADLTDTYECGAWLIPPDGAIQKLACA